MRFLSSLILLGVVTTAVAQDAQKYACTDKDRVAAEEYLSKRVENDAIADNLRQPRKGMLPFCWDSCVVILPKPWYPQAAKRLGVHGPVTVYAIADENGKIIYAEPVAGPELLRDSARQAACKSAFNPIRLGDKRLKFPWTIKYNFEKATNAQIL